MKRKYFNTLAALVCLGALWGSWALREKWKSRRAPKSEAAGQEKVLAVDSNHIRSLMVRPRKGEVIACRREGENWSIVAPRKLSADQSAISSFLSSLTSATVDQVVDPQPKNLKEYGLDPPSATVEVTTNTKPEKVALLIGDETPTGGGVYVQVAGNPRVVTLASYMRTSLEKNLFDLRDKRATTLDVDHLQRIDVEAKGKRWSLAKNPQGVWDLVLPPPVRADRFTVDGLVDKLRNLSMQKVVAENKTDLAKYGFDKPELRVKLAGAHGNQTLILGKKSGSDYHAMNSALAPAFTLGSDFLTQFQKDPSDLRDKDLFSFSTFDANRVEVETPKGRRVFEKQQDKWKQTVPSAKDEPTDKVEALLDRLRGLRAESFPRGRELSTFGLTKPGFKFQVRFGEKNETETVEAARVGEHAYARRPADALASQLSKTALEDVEKALGEL